MSINSISHTFAPAYQPQSNSLPERLNHSIMDAARCALRHSKLPDRFSDWAFIDATYKYNILPHSTTGRVPLYHWNSKALRSHMVIPFCAAVWVPIPPVKTKTKLTHRARPARYLYQLNSTPIFVLLIYSIARANYRTVDIRPIHLALNPSLTLSSAFRTRFNNPHSTIITPATAAPPSINHARRYPDAALCATAHEDEIAQLNAQRAIDCLPRKDVPSDCRPISLTMI